MRTLLFGTLVLLAGGLAGCTAVPAAPPPAPVPAPAPPAPPAACLLDPAALERATGLGWVADGVPATDSRCVYDPTGGDRSAFVVVDLADGTDVETPAALCADGTRSGTASGGLVCRFGDGVLGVGVTGGRTVALAAAAVPDGTDAARLQAAFGAELDRLAAR